MPRYAAIDIGSNSVRMQAAEATVDNPVQVLASDREVTRLGTGVFRNGLITEDAITVVCSVLARMSATYQKLHVIGVRAVATSAVRDARNQAEFIARASAALGTPVEIISGTEEARLIHLGVQSRWPHPKQRIAIVDVGGGSAEVILSENGRMTDGISRPLGAVRLSEVFLKNDPALPAEIHRMEQFIEEKMAVAVRRLEEKPVDRVIATSGTAATIVCSVNQVPRARREEADRLRASAPQIRKFFAQIRVASLSQRKRVAGIGPKRAEIIVAGTAVFLKLLDAFHGRALYYSAAGVRDGIIADLAFRGVGRERSQLTADQLRAVEALARKFGVPVRDGRRTASFGHELFVTLQSAHKLSGESGRLLSAACYLLETGHFVSGTAHHKHSEYLVRHADLPGFTDRERRLIAALCRYHRKSMPSPRHESFQTLTAEEKRSILLLSPLVRIAAALDTGEEKRVESIRCTAGSMGAEVTLFGNADLELQLWSAERAAEVFRQVYGFPITFTRGTGSAT